MTSKSPWTRRSFCEWEFLKGLLLFIVSLSLSLFFSCIPCLCLRSLNRHLSPLSRGERSDFALVPVYREKLNLYREENAREIRWYPAERIRVSRISSLYWHFSLIRVHDVEISSPSRSESFRNIQIFAKDEWPLTYKSV